MWLSWGFDNRIRFLKYPLTKFFGAFKTEKGTNEKRLQFQHPLCKTLKLDNMKWKKENVHLCLTPLYHSAPLFLSKCDKKKSVCKSSNVCIVVYSCVWTRARSVTPQCSVKLERWQHKTRKITFYQEGETQ